MGEQSDRLFQEAQDLLVGGVNSPVRAFGAVGGRPPFIHRGHGPRVTDVDNQTYLDYVGAWGPLILGHSNPRILQAIRGNMARGTAFGTCTRDEVELARLVREAVPMMERVRFVNSGTEATMSALRLARGVTGRPRIVKMAGGYHGHADALLVEAGSGAATFGVPSSAGVTEGAARDTLVVPYNDPGAVAGILDREGDQVAAVILEPVAGNMGVVPPLPGYLESLREITREAGTLLIFDEVMTGFRVAPGGAQERYGVTPDLTCLGKILGAGLPVGAFGGPARTMEHLSPLGPVYQAGTLSGNPLAMRAGIEALHILKEYPPYDELEAAGRKLEGGIVRAAEGAGVPVTVQRVASMLTVFFTEGPVRNFDDARRGAGERFGRFHQGLLRRGIYWPPSPFEAAFISAAHQTSDLLQTLDAIKATLTEDL